MIHSNIRFHITVLLAATSLAVGAQNEQSAPPKQKGVIGFAHKVMNFLDTMAVSGIDTTYIAAPKLPWQVMTKLALNQSDVKMKSIVSGSGMSLLGITSDVLCEPRIRTDVSAAVGAWVGYRGYGIGLSKQVAGDKGFYLVLTAMGGRYGANIRFHNFKTNNPQVRFRYNTDEGLEDYSEEIDLGAPIKVNTVTADAYYMFNGKRFSYSAAYDQSMLQLRSAGSFIVGATYFSSSINYADNRNADMIFYMNDVGKMKQWQASLGVGYAYNYVPHRNWLISMMAMPNVSFVNHIKAYRYSSNRKENYIQFLGNPDDYDYLGFLLDDNQWKIMPENTVSRNSSLKLNVDVRLAVTYNIGRFFVAAYGTVTQHNSNYDGNKTRNLSWYVNSFFGYRF